MVAIQCGVVLFQTVQAVLFDKDGTLADSQDFLRNLGQKRARLIDARIPGVQDPLLMAFGLEGDRLNPAGLLAVGTRQDNEIAAAAYVAETGRDWLEARSIAGSAFTEADTVFQRKADHTPLLADGLKLLQMLSRAGLKLGILSSDSTENVHDFVERYQLQPYVQVAIGVEAGQPSKPDPRVLQQACRALEVEPGFVLVIGDSAADIEVAQAAGTIGCIAVTWGGAHAAQLGRAAAVVSRVEQIQVLA